MERARSRSAPTWLERIADGDAEALGELYDRYGRVAFGVLYRMLPGPEAAEEVAQDAFHSVWRQARSYRAERGSVRTWSISSAAAANISVPIGDRISWLAIWLNAARRSFRSWMAVVYSARGITINAVCPGPILTGLRQHSQTILGPGVPDISGRGIAVNDDQIRAVVPAGRRGTVEDIASAVCFLVSDDAAYMSGHALVVDGGWRAK